MQHPPVRGQYIFQTPKDLKFAALSKEAEIWKHFQVFELQKNFMPICYVQELTSNFVLINAFYIHQSFYRFYVKILLM